MFGTQSTSCYSEKLISYPDFIAHELSKTPVVEKAQHEPQLPWSLIGVTFPALTQSTPTDQSGVT